MPHWDKLLKPIHRKLKKSREMVEYTLKPQTAGINSKGGSDTWYFLTLATGKRKK